MTAIPVIDLFAGPGGLSEGFSAHRGTCRFQVALSVEKDAAAHRTLELRSFFRQFAPCQAPELYYRYIRGDGVAREELPTVFVMENVKGILSSRHQDEALGSVAMKLNNLTSLDPEEKARGVAGLPGASQLDRQVWNEFHADWERMVTESEFLWEKTIRHHEVLPSQEDAGATKKACPLPEALPDNLPTGPTEGERTVKVRLAQGFFRRTVLAAYHGLLHLR